MPNQEQERKPTLPLSIEITNDFTGVRLEGIRKDQIPHADLIQATMNASAMILFKLSPDFSVEGGLEGMYKGYPVQLRNWGGDVLGISEENNCFVGTGTNGKPIKRILNFYEQFLNLMFKKDKSFLKEPSLQTTEAVWTKLKDAMRRLGDDTLPTKVMALLVKDEEGRRFLRGLTDEEIVQSFVPPPFE